VGKEPDGKCLSDYPMSEMMFGGGMA
jgi:hypothetical protein